MEISVEIFSVRLSIRVRLFSLITVTWLAYAVLPSNSSAGGLGVNDVLTKMEGAGKGIKAMQADFRQVRIYFLFDERRESAGTIYYKKPDKMLWRYKKPDNNSIYINGKRALMYLPDIKQVQKISLLKDRKTESLLIGFGNTANEIKRNFSVKLLPGKDNLYILELTPKTEELSSHFLRLRLTLDAKNWLPVRSERFEVGGDKTVFTFSNVKINVPMKDGLFEFTVPEDVEVVEY